MRRIYVLIISFIYIKNVYDYKIIANKPFTGANEYILECFTICRTWSNLGAPTIRIYLLCNSKHNIIFLISGPGKFKVEDLRPALPLCTHLIYGYAGINPKTLEVVSLDRTLDTGVGYSDYRLVTQFKKSYPNLKLYLSIGGNADPYEETHKYLVAVSEQLFNKLFDFKISFLLYF